MSAYCNLGVHRAPKSPAVRRLRQYMSWVQSAVMQFGPYLLDSKAPIKNLVREERFFAANGFKAKLLWITFKEAT